MGDKCRKTVRLKEGLVAWRYLLADLQERNKEDREYISHDTLARMIGMKMITFMKYNRGDIPRISLHYFFEYCRALDIDSTEFFSGLAKTIEKDKKENPDDYK